MFARECKIVEAVSCSAASGVPEFSSGDREHLAGAFFSDCDVVPTQRPALQEVYDSGAGGWCSVASDPLFTWLLKGENGGASAFFFFFFLSRFPVGAEDRPLEPLARVVQKGVRLRSLVDKNREV